MKKPITINLAGERKGQTMNPLLQRKTTPPLLITLPLLANDSLVSRSCS
jgi:hypothetical protein